MGINAKKVSYGSSSVKPLAPEAYPARVVQVIDLGLQEQRPYKGQEKPPAYMLNVTYELGTEFMTGDDGEPDTERPRWVSEMFPLFNLNADKAKSTKRYLALDPSMEAQGDWSQMVGKPCLVAIVNNENNGKVYNNVGNVGVPVRGLEVPELVNEGRVFDLDNPDMEVFDRLPDWLQEKIRGNLEYNGSELQRLLETDSPQTPEPQVEAPKSEVMDDEVPF